MSVADRVFLGLAIAAVAGVSALIYHGRPGRPATLKSGEIPPAILGTSAAPLPPTSDATLTASTQELILSAAADAALTAGRQGHPLTSLTVRVDGKDRLGSPVILPALTLTWDPEDAARVDWAHADAFTLINLSLVAIDGRAGAQAAYHWCFGEEPRKGLTPAFCGKPYEDAVSDFMND